jgi:Tol biopolymer transport system component
MRADGSGQHLLVADLPHHDDGQVSPDFSPDGHRIAVVKGARLLTMRLDGSHRQVLSGRSTILIEPAYSPDGRCIAAIRLSRRRLAEIMVMNVDGSHKRTIKTHVYARGTSGMFGISWQPLGR